MVVKGSLLVAGINVLGGAVETAVGAGVLLDGLIGVYAFLDVLHHRAHLDVLVADDFVVFVEGELGDVAFCKLKVAGAFGEGAVEGARLRAEAFAEVFKAGADGQTAFGVGTLGAAIDDLEEEFAHGGVDGVAHQVGVEGLKHGLAGENLRSHSSGVGHARAADGFDEGFLDDALLHVERQLAGTLLRRTPTHAVGETGDVLNLGGCCPSPLLRDGCGAVIAALLDATHMFNFCRVLHKSMCILA